MQRFEKTMNCASVDSQSVSVLPVFTTQASPALVAGSALVSMYWAAIGLNWPCGAAGNESVVPR